MKKFTKLALASSIAFSANAMAMQALDDAQMSATTGQDGITIGIGISKITIEKLFIHDNDGLSATATGNAVGGLKTDANGVVYKQGTYVTGPQTVPTDGSNPANGVTVIPNYAMATKTAEYDKTAAAANLGGTGGAAAIVIYGNSEAGHVNEKHGLVIGANYDRNGAYLLDSRNLADLVIDSDAGTVAGGGAFINIAAEVSGLDIHIGKIGIVGSAAVGNDPNSIRRGSTGDVNDILSGLSIKTGPMAANIQLGAAPQGAMIKLNASMMGGLEILNLGVLDNSTKQGDADGTAGNRAAGEIFVDSIKVTDALSNDLTLNQSISIFGEEANDKGFLRIVSTGGAHDTYVKGVHLGSRTAASIGDVEVQGMQTYYSPTQGTYHPGAVITIRGH